MGNHDRFIAICGTHRIPARWVAANLVVNRSQLLHCLLSRPVGINHSLKKRVAGQAVGPMQPRARCLAYDIKSFYVGLAFCVYQNPATHVMGCGDHWDGLFGYVYTQRKTLLVNVWKTLPHKARIFVRDVQEDTVVSTRFQLSVNRASHNIPAGQVLLRVVICHESTAS